MKNINVAVSDKAHEILTQLKQKWNLHNLNDVIEHLAVLHKGEV